MTLHSLSSVSKWPILNTSLFIERQYTSLMILRSLHHFQHSYALFMTPILSGVSPQSDIKMCLISSRHVTIRDWDRLCSLVGDINIPVALQAELGLTNISSVWIFKFVQSRVWRSCLRLLSILDCNRELCRLNSHLSDMLHQETFRSVFPSQGTFFSALSWSPRWRPVRDQQPLGISLSSPVTLKWARPESPAKVNPLYTYENNFTQCSPPSLWSGWEITQYGLRVQSVKQNK